MRKVLCNDEGSSGYVGSTRHIDAAAASDERWGAAANFNAVTSRGNALVHEMKALGKPDDATRYDHPVTMIYLDSDQLMLTHYCDAGNRPRMVGKVSPDGKKVEFEFLDVAGSTAIRTHAPCGVHRD